jgi:hypothetical protein
MKFIKIITMLAICLIGNALAMQIERPYKDFLDASAPRYEEQTFPGYPSLASHNCFDEYRTMNGAARSLWSNTSRESTTRLSSANNITVSYSSSTRFLSFKKQEEGTDPITCFIPLDENICVPHEWKSYESMICMLVEQLKTFDSIDSVSKSTIASLKGQVKRLEDILRAAQSPELETDKRPQSFISAHPYKATLLGVIGLWALNKFILTPFCQR